MKRLFLILIVCLFIQVSCKNQQNRGDGSLPQVRIDNLLDEYNIPGIAICIFSGDTIYEFVVSGIKRLGYTDSIIKESIWHLGSNTKSFIAFAAASMVEDELISWETKFFDLFPSYRDISQEDYSDITLMQLLQHRAGLPLNTRSFPELILKFIEIDTILERRTLFEWALEKDKYHGGYQYSNIGYVMAASMLEKASGQSWKDILDKRIFTPLRMKAYYGWPASCDTTETWGHLVDPVTGEFMPHPPDDLYKLERFGFGPAGNLSLSIPDFVSFLQDNLRGWNGKQCLLSNESYRMMHTGSEYGLGWGIVEVINDDYSNVSIHSGSAGTFFSKALLFKDENLGVVICMNRYVKNNNDLILPLVNEILDDWANKKIGR